MKKAKLKKRLKQLEQENAELRTRIELLEMTKPQPYTPVSPPNDFTFPPKDTTGDPYPYWVPRIWCGQSAKVITGIA